MTKIVNHVDVLVKLNACGDAIGYARSKPDAESAWRDCERGDWLLWIAASLGVDRNAVVLAVCDCVEMASFPWPEGDDRPRRAIETARAWIRGEASIDEVRAAANAAYAAYAANAANAAANTAANAAAYAAGRAANAAYRQSLSESANIVRKHISWEMIEEKIGVEHAKEVRDANACEPRTVGMDSLVSRRS